MSQAANATVVPGQSIAGVKLGDTERQVAKLFPHPSCAKCFSANVDWLYLGNSPVLGADFKNHRLIEVTTVSTSQSTPGGLHANGGGGDKPESGGSSLAELKAAYSKVECFEEQSFGFATCRLKGHDHGRRSYTLFQFYTTQGGLARIKIGYGNSPEEG
jgi:hypothetical protein